MNTNLTFGEAIELIKQDKAVRRKGWNGKNMLICLNKGSYDIEPNGEQIHIEGVPNKLFEYGFKGTTTRLPNINMKNAQGNNVTGWLASQTDMLAEDWEEIISE